MQTPFLQQVAEYFYQDETCPLSQRTFIFPSKRALAFFEEYLKEACRTRPIFAPRMITIADFLSELQPDYSVPDKTELLFHLYDCYREVRGTEAEPFDQFLYWGGIILGDFDTCDRYLVDVHSLFRNATEWHELDDDFSHIEDEDLRKRLIAYFGHLRTLQRRTEEERAEDQRSYLAFWESLTPVYDLFHERLQTLPDHPTYEGYIYRQAAQMEVDTLRERLGQERHLVFVGLFDLTPSEKAFLRQLKKLENWHEEGQEDYSIEFCWDAWVQVVQDAHHPVREEFLSLCEHFGQVPGPWADPRGQVLLPAEVQVIHCSSLIAQTKGLPSLLGELEAQGHYQPRSEASVAVVLPDEGMLLSVANSLPTDLEHPTNITLGYPLSHTPIARFIRRWLHLIEYVSGRVKNHGRHTSEIVLELLSQRLIVDLFAHRTEPGEQAPTEESVDWLGDYIHRVQSYRRVFLSYQDLDLVPWAELRQRILSWRADGRTAHALELTNQELMTLLLAPLRSAEELLLRLEVILLELNYRAKDIAQEVLEESLLRDESEDASLLREVSFDREFAAHYLHQVYRLERLLRKHLEAQSAEALQSPELRHSVIHLIQGMIDTVSIPFEGKLLEGLQIMGLLETRSIQLPTLIYLSAQEGTFPRNGYTSSLIPPLLRRAFDLPTSSKDDLGQDYYFYQSLSRAERVYFLIAPATELASEGEESRYISQLRHLYYNGGDHTNAQQEHLLYQGGRAVGRITERILQLRSEYRKAQPIIKLKEGPEWQAYLERITTRPQLDKEGSYRPHPLSPSALTTYMSCPLKFYYEQVLKLRSTDEASLELAPNDYGSILHAVMERIYAIDRNDMDRIVTYPNTLTADFLSKLHTPLYKRRIQEIIREEYALIRLSQGRPKGTPRREQGLSALDEIFLSLIYQDVRYILEVDEAYAPFTIEATEMPHYMEVPVELEDGTTYSVYVGGRIDRIDSKRVDSATLAHWDAKNKVFTPEERERFQLDDPAGGSRLLYRVVDYKTGRAERTASGLTGLKGFRDSSRKAVFQSWLYSYSLNEHPAEKGYTPAVPALYVFPGTEGMRRKKKEYDWTVEIKDPERKGSNNIVEPEEVLSELLEELLNPEIPFVQAEKDNPCQYCHFALGCGRKQS